MENEGGTGRFAEHVGCDVAPLRRQTDVKPADKGITPKRSQRRIDDLFLDQQFE